MKNAKAEHKLKKFAIWYDKLVNYRDYISFQKKIDYYAQSRDRVRLS